MAEARKTTGPAGAHTRRSNIGVGKANGIPAAFFSDAGKVFRA
jgi:hypothetical protein